MMMKFQPMIFVVILAALMSGCVASMPIAPVEQTASEMTAGDVAENSVVDEHDHGMGTLEELGEVNFPVSCTAEAQTEFNHGMAFLHSFWFAPAIEAFSAVAELDPTCGMAHWGIAMSLLSIPWSPTPQQALVDGWAVVEKATEVGGATPREQAYIDAITLFYKDYETLDHPTRARAYEQAMEQLVQAYPEDTEARVFYGLALNITAPPTDKSYANQFKAAEMLEPIFVAQSDHPGAAHYLIHTHDYPPLAADGLAAARRYAEIAPTAPHALHMPSHIFTRLGYWHESIESNRASAQAIQDELSSAYPEGTGFDDALHAMDYMMYAYMQLGQDGAAQALLDEIAAMEQVNAENLGSVYALTAIPARYVLERGQWDEAAVLRLHPTGLAWERFPQAEASLVFARGLGAARAGDVASARQELEQLQSLHEALITGADEYWASQVEIQSREVEAWIAWAEGSNEEALALMREAAELAAATDKHPVTPAPIVPAHELLGEMLLALEQPAEAFTQFEASLRVEPNRLRSIYGAARAAELAGEMESARGYYEALLALGADADSERAELTAAQAFLGE